MPISSIPGSIKHQSSESPASLPSLDLPCNHGQVYTLLPSLISGTPSQRGNLAYPFPGLGYQCLQGFGGSKDRKERRKLWLQNHHGFLYKVQVTTGKFGNRRNRPSWNLPLWWRGEGWVVLNHKQTEEGGVADGQTQLSDYKGRRKWESEAFLFWDSEAFRVSEIMEMHASGLGWWRCGVKCSWIHWSMSCSHPPPS